MSLEQWAFSDAETCQTADGRHTFYRVRGERVTKRDTGYGFSMTVDQSGMLMSCPVTGEGATPEAALDDSMRRAIQEDDRASATMWNAQVSLMGGRNFR